MLLYIHKKTVRLIMATSTFTPLLSSELIFVSVKKISKHGA